MTFHSITKNLFVLVILLFNVIISAQESTSNDYTEESTKGNFFSSEERQNFFVIMVGGHKPFTSGDNFMGKGLKGKSGIDFRVQMYVYKQFFIGVASGASYLDVKNQELLGNYKKTRISENYFYLGYEFLPAESLRLGVNISIDGDLRYKNTGFSSSDIADQYDSAKLNRYGFYLNYELGRHFMLYLDYGYNISKTNINTPSTVEDFFSKGKYSTIGLGLVFTIGSRDLISRFLD
ncbi:hypothetical protein [uncultured Winogradskyella sp.]|uniref:hypothetical protein n=1 Tax=uncultured Winogradskyella sp. TaxID=395353 RepID=UPI002620EFBB|nr:hypothetical protein [uncultured Winogradskyella sp.]